jgi:hypothetical protein
LRPTDERNKQIALDSPFDRSQLLSQRPFRPTFSQTKKKKEEEECVSARSIADAADPNAE